MYRRNNNRRNNTSRPRDAGNRRNNKPRTPYCKVCHDAGKPKSEYTSHYVKDRPGPHGKVCCPYLLSLVCRYCHNTGHTPNHCPEVKAKESRRDAPKPQRREHAACDGWSTVPGKGNTRRRAQRPKEVVSARAVTNQFDALSFEPTQAQKDERKEFPMLGADKRTSSKSDDEEDYSAVTEVPKLTGWSKVATSAPPVKKEVKPAPIPVTTSTYVSLKNGGQSWADMMDEEDEDLEEGEIWEQDTPSFAMTAQSAVSREYGGHFDRRREIVDNSAWSSCGEEDEEQYEEDYYGGRGSAYYQDSDSDW